MLLRCPPPVLLFLVRQKDLKAATKESKALAAQEDREEAALKKAQAKAAKSKADAKVKAIEGKGENQLNKSRVGLPVNPSDLPACCSKNGDQTIHASTWPASNAVCASTAFIFLSVKSEESSPARSRVVNNP